MKKLFTLFAFLACFLGANAIEIVDAEVDFSQYTDISQVKWGGWNAQEAMDRLSIQEGCLHFHSEEATDPSWACQFHPIGGVSAEEGVVYTLHYKIKGSIAQNVSMLGFGQTPYGQFAITTDWVEGTVDYVGKPGDNGNVDGSILMQCGDYVGDWDIAYLKITHEGREQKPVDWKNMITNGDAAAAWADPNQRVKDADGKDLDFGTVCAWSKEYKRRDAEDKELIHPCDIEDGVFVCKTDEVNPPLVWDSDGEQWGVQHAAGDPKPDNEWQNQFWIALPRPLKKEEPYKVSFKYKASEPATASTQNHKAPGDYLGNGQIEGSYNFTTEWQTYESKELSAAEGMQSIAFNLGVNKQYEKNIIFYFKDIEVSTMELKEGLFAAGIDAEKENFNLFNFDNAIELTYDAEVDAYVGIVGTEDEDGWVNQAMVSTVYGHDKGFKANAINVKGKVANDPENWVQYEAASNAKINFPVRGQWEIMVAPETQQIAFQKLVGEPDKVAIEINPNPAEITVYGLERDDMADAMNDDGTLKEQKEELGGTGNAWDNQMWIVANRALKKGEATIIEFDYVANVDEAKTTTQCQGGNPGPYMHWNCIGDVVFNTTEGHFTKEFTIPEEADGMQSIAFNMAEIRGACNYTIKNVIWKLDDDTESLIDQEGTANFWVKEGAGTAPRLFGTDPVDGITNVVSKKAASKGTFNFAGQRVAKGYKGLVVTDGVKYMSK